MNRCGICETPTINFLSLGKMPIANGFLSPEQFKDEYFYNLGVSFCELCCMVQLDEQPDMQKMFHENYAFYSSTSKGMAAHFEKFANEVIEQYKPEFTVEIGSNDGIMLKHFASKGLKHLGVEPSSNVSEEAKKIGVNTITSFFNEETAKQIVQDYGQADAILSANVMCHIRDINEVMRAIKILLKKDGVAIFEDPYLGDILEKTSYDQIYDEHAYYFSANSVNYLVRQYGMHIVDIKHQEVHGGSMRYTIANQGVYIPNVRVRNAFMKEYINHFESITPYETFRRNVEFSKEKLNEILGKLKSEGKRIVGYAATAKSATILNYCGITSDTIDCIYDTTPIKQGKFSPGMHIPVKAHWEFHTKDEMGNVSALQDYAFLFAWNHSKEIMEKEKSAFKGKWITHIPEVHIID